MNPVLRAAALLADPAATWKRIEQETGDAAYLLVAYVALFALVPVVSGFIEASSSCCCSLMILYPAPN